MRAVRALFACVVLFVTACGGGTTEEWDLVALGDSTPTGYGAGAQGAYTYQYAALLEQDLNVTVEVHDRSSNSTRSVARWVDLVRTDDTLRDELSQAEVVTIWLGWHDVIGTAMAFSGEWSGDNQDRFAEATLTMPGDFQDLLAGITEIVPAEGHVLIADVGIPPALIERWSEEPYWPEMKQAMHGTWRDGLVEAAEVHGVTVIHIARALGGQAGEVVPDSELLQADGLHFSAEGHAFLAEVHRAEDGLTAD